MSYNDRIEIELCPLCKVAISGNAMGFKKEIPHDGVVLNFGFSRGGWGFRQNHLEFSDEVCAECYDELEKAFMPLKDKFEELKRTRRAEDGKKVVRKRPFESLLKLIGGTHAS